VSLFEPPITFLGGSLPGLRRLIFFSTSLVTGMHSQIFWEKIPPGTNGQFDPEEGFILLAQQGVGSTAHQTGKNPGLNSGLPQEAEGETDHLPETPE
jgi:hypothetical protein